MTPLPVLSCNRCGECCRQGGLCILRDSNWSFLDHPGLLKREFQGPCELLRGNDCAVIARLERDGRDADLRMLKIYRTV